MVRDDFIGVFENALTPAECGDIIGYFNEMQKYNLVYKRPEPAHNKKDLTVFMMEPETLYSPRTNPVMQSILDKIWKCYDEYRETYSMLSVESKQGILSMRVQKTSPGGGFHDWHYENRGVLNSNRFLAFSVYLNTVTEGGETEFLYQRARISPTQGTVLIWPAGFTHTHRGNQPLSGDKYIVTGWIEFFE